MGNLCPFHGCACKIAECALFDSNEKICGFLAYHRRSEEHLRKIHMRETPGVIQRFKNFVNGEGAK